jgi:BirA family biotin operon repressor/biotin-[acetyl-CoA-carboxylase] ligase
MININNAEVKMFNEIDSTNSAAREHLNIIGEISDPIWFRSKKQTKGRGRNKNNWVSEEGNLFTTLLTPISWKLNIIPMLSCVIAVSIHQSVSLFLDNETSLKIKWPNDILFENSKLSGVLIENQLNSDNKFSIIGIGVNIISSPENLDHQTAYLNNLTSKTDNLLENFFDVLKEKIHTNLNYFNERTIDHFREYALSKLWKLNKDVEFNYLGRAEKGVLAGLSDSYEIELKIKNEIKKFNSGEISIRK